MGRPALPDELKRKVRTIRMTDQEWDDIRSAATGRGVSASAYLRILTRPEARRAAGRLKP